MYLAFLPLFIIRLTVVALPTIFQLTWVVVKRKPALVSTIVICLIGILALTTHLFPLPASQTATRPVEGLSNSANGAQLQLQQTQLFSELQLQPTHRDLLYNLSVVESALGNQEQSNFYYNQAIQLDPNHQIFTQHSPTL